MGNHSRDVAIEDDGYSAGPWYALRFHCLLPAWRVFHVSRAEQDESFLAGACWAHAAVIDDFGNLVRVPA